MDLPPAVEPVDVPATIDVACQSSPRSIVPDKIESLCSNVAQPYPRTRQADVDIKVVENAVFLLKSVEANAEEREQVRSELTKMKAKEVKKVCSLLNVTMGNAGKAALIERLVAYSEMGLLKSGQYNADEALKVLTYVTPEVKGELDKLPDFKAVEERKWSKKLSGVMTSIEYMNIYVYLVERRSKTLSDRQEANFKSLKGYSYFASGWVENTWITEVGYSYRYVRGYVYQSYPSPTRRPYEVYVCLNASGKVFSGKCKCVAGLGESCSHVAASFFHTKSSCGKERAFTG